VVAPTSSRDSETRARQAVRANVAASVEQLRSGSTILEYFVEKDKLLIVGAEYSLETGSVEFL
jgi:carbonic anhydrase